MTFPAASSFPGVFPSSSAVPFLIAAVALESFLSWREAPDAAGLPA